MMEVICLTFISLSHLSNFLSAGMQLIVFSSDLYYLVFLVSSFSAKYLPLASLVNESVTQEAFDDIVDQIEMR